MTVYDRIRQLRIEKRMTQTDLALKLGYKDGSMITKIESGSVDISQRKLVAFADALDTTPAYLMGWVEFPERTFNDRLTPDEHQLVVSYRSLSPFGKEKLLDRCEELKLLYGKKSEDTSAQSV